MTFYLEIAKVDGLPNVNNLKISKLLFMSRAAKQGNFTRLKPKLLISRSHSAKKLSLKLKYTAIPSSILILVYLLEKYNSMGLDLSKKIN
jgi:hypothetical protein